MLNQLLTEQEAFDEFQRMMEGVRGKKWMAVIWEVEDGILTCKGKTTWRFPTGDFESAAKLMLKVLRQETETVPSVPEPLKSANFLRPEDRPEKKDSDNSMDASEGSILRVLSQLGSFRRGDDEKGD